MAKKKIRKPRDTKDFYCGTDVFSRNVVRIYDENADSAALTLKDAKRLHKWLGRAIEYLEAR